VATLEIIGLRKRFGGVVALAGVDLTVTGDEILGLIGPNGSGKSTLFNVVCGLHKPTAGRVLWNGSDITGRRPHEIARLGLGHTFQQAMAFPALTVRENVRIALEHGAVGRWPRRWSSPEEILAFVGLDGLADEQARIMPFGNMRRLGIAIALGGHPDKLLLDEPAAGLSESESADLVDLILGIHRLGVGVCVVDHRVSLITALCQRLVVLHFGTKIADGPTEQVLGDPKVIEVYLGSER
jgi:ABC-type branched-subunit amino acid transport system ATPase component